MFAFANKLREQDATSAYRWCGEVDMATGTVSSDDGKVPQEEVEKWTFPIQRFKEKPIFRLVKEICIELGIPEQYWTDYHSMFLTKWKAANKGIVVKGEDDRKDSANKPTKSGGKEVKFPGVFGSIWDHAKEYPIQAGLTIVLMIAAAVLFKMGMWQWGVGCLPVAAVALFWNGETMGMLLVVGAAALVGAVIGGVTLMVFPSAALPLGALTGLVAWWAIGKFVGV